MEIFYGSTYKPEKVTGKLRKFMPFEFLETITEAVPALREDRQLSAAS